jgi:hypothetical protein
VLNGRAVAAFALVEMVRTVWKTERVSSAMARNDASLASVANWLIVYCVEFNSPKNEYSASGPLITRVQ